MITLRAEIRPTPEWAIFPKYAALESLLDPRGRSRFSMSVAHQEASNPLTWSHSRSLSIALLRPGHVSDGRWDTFVRSFEQVSTTRLLLLVLGSVEIPAGYRRALTRAIGDRRVAAVVDGVVGRELVTALNWSGVTIESFPISHLREALGSLDPEAEGEPIELCLDLAARLIGLTATGAAA